MKKIFAIPSFLAAMVLFATTVYAQDLQHAYQPVVQNTGWTNARVNNVVRNPSDNLICVEAFRTTDNAKMHLGCLPVTNWGASNWSVEFNAPTNWLPAGATYTVKYTYPSAGQWRPVTDMMGNTMNGTVMK